MNKLQIIQTAKPVGLTMGYRKKDPPKVFGMGPTKSLIRPWLNALATVGWGHNNEY